MTGAELLAVAEEAARAAGDVLTSRFGRERALATKSSPTDVVSEADHAAEDAIRAVLARHVPDDAIVGEEGEDVAGTTGRRWIVDPLDGTVNFLFGVPQWCVSVACEGEAGVVWDPLRDELFTATADGPPRLNGEALQASSCGELSQALVATGFGYDSAQRAVQGEVAAAVLPRVRDLRRLGSAALDLAWCAAGRYDAYYEHGVKAWDTAAGELLCARAGLEVHHLPETEALPSGILVATPAIAGELLELVSR